MHDKLLKAAISCPHSISHPVINLYFDNTQEGHNALNQLGKRLDAAATEIYAEGRKDEREEWLPVLEALKRLVAEPHGCAFCDSGKPRKSVATGELCEHEPACGFELARAAIAKATGNAYVDCGECPRISTGCKDRCAKAGGAS